MSVFKTLAAGTAFAAAFGLSACSSNPSAKDIGTLGGAGAGALVGSGLTGGSTLGTVGGAVGGAYLGQQAGKKYEEKHPNSKYSH